MLFLESFHTTENLKIYQPKIFCTPKNSLHHMSFGMPYTAVHLNITIVNSYFRKQNSFRCTHQFEYIYVYGVQQN